MLSRKHAILAGAAMSAVPLASQASVLTYKFDPTYYVSTTSGGTETQLSASAVTGTAANPIVTVPLGDYLYIQLDASVTAPGPQFVTGLATSPTSGAPTGGLLAWQVGLTDGNFAASGAGLATATINPVFSSLSTTGVSDGNGGTLAATGQSGSLILGGTTKTTNLQLGVSAPVALYSGLRINPKGAALTTSGTQTTFTVTSNNTAINFSAQGADTTGSTPSHTYVNRAFTVGTDTLSALPSLTIVYGASTTTTPTGHPIIALTSTANGSYGSTVATLAVNGSSGGYMPAYASVASLNTGSAAATFTPTPTSGSEVYALKLTGPAGATLTAAQIQTIITDINASSATDGVVASTIGSAFTNVFPGYQVELTADALAGSASLGFDFTQETSVAGVVVTGVAAVPEPATAAGLVLGATGLLLGRRKNRMA
jgi:hypothetical protein